MNTRNGPRLWSFLYREPGIYPRYSESCVVGTCELAHSSSYFDSLVHMTIKPWSIDVKPVAFTVSASCVTISNPASLSSSETGLNPGIRSWKKHLSEWAQWQKAICGIYFTKKWRTETLQPGLAFDNFKPQLKSSIFKCISWLNGSFLGGDDLGFWKTESRPI
jgi:hypothetical protein